MATRCSVCELRLPPQERVLVQNSIAELRANDPSIKNLALWGKIHGDTNDYLVLVALNVGESIGRTYFVSSDGGNSFAQVPEVDDDSVAARCTTLYRAFEGTLGFVYPTPKSGTSAAADEEAGENDAEDEESAEDENAGDILNDTPRPATLTEMHRLAWTLREIDRCCAVAPFGAYTMRPTKVIGKDPTFKGLDAKRSLSLASYAHLRQPESARVKQQLQRAATPLHRGARCLDPIENDVPKGVWVPRLDEDESEVTLRSLQWSGHEFVARLGAPDFYNVYFGSGLQNHDVVFMI